jgi:putative DNA primase/helicase
MSFSDDLLKFQANVRPAMLADLGTTLGVSPESLTKLGIGWFPLEACWVFPERDEKGTVIGLVRRYRDKDATGRIKKFCVPESRRGLTYQLNQEIGDAYIAGKQNWIQVEKAGVNCPICGHGDWCLVSVENPEDPNAVICGRRAEGATRPLGEAGYLHIRKDAGIVSHAAVLPMSDVPVLVVEGQSDVAAANDLGFVGVGKPSASGGLGYLASILTGRSVIIIGENDSGAGKLGMEKTFEALRPVIKDLVRIMPPADIKDLRAWKQRGLTQEQLLEAAKSGSRDTSGDILEDKSPLAIAELWLRTERSHNGIPILRKYLGEWCLWNGTHYTMIDEEADIRGTLYRFLQMKKYRDFGSKGEVSLKPFDPNRSKVADVIDALTMTCPIAEEPPCWLGEKLAPADSILTFTNGLLDTEKWIEQPGLGLIAHTPEYFCLSSLPYEYDPKAGCPVWLKFLEEVFPEDPVSRDLLQEWFGYNMLPNTSYEKLMMLVGRPGAGKGTVLEALRSILGHSQVVSTSFDALTSDFGLAPLMGKLAAILPDAHTTKRGDAMKALEVVKSISGRDFVSVNRKYLPHVESCRLSCRITIGVNDLPDLPDHARTLERRLLLLYFSQSFSDRADIHLKDKVAAEAQGIAMWALEGLRRLRIRGVFSDPESSRPITESFRNQISPITEFSEECCNFGNTEKHWSLKQMMYDAWMAWAKAQGLGNSLAYSTRAKFDQRFLSLNIGVIPQRKNIRGVQTAGYLGVRLTDDAASRYL